MSHIKRTNSALSSLSNELENMTRGITVDENKMKMSRFSMRLSSQKSLEERSPYSVNYMYFIFLSLLFIY